ncbi:MAG: hypothetical protein SCALA702_00290 [Melioribacteraceae bacterium]|nr:MAG: hypothetical protein SCALA702_00290 [Melioribacteraceae bacterium]
MKLLKHVFSVLIMNVGIWLLFDSMSYEAIMGLIIILGIQSYWILTGNESNIKDAIEKSELRMKIQLHEKFIESKKEV